MIYLMSGLLAAMSVAFTALAVAFRALRLVHAERQVAGFRKFEAVGDAFRLELIAHWSAKGKAYHVGEDGRVYVVPAETYYHALIAGLYTFWELVDEFGGKSCVVSVDEIDFKAGDGKGYLTYVDTGYCDAYIDTPIINVFPNSYPSRGVTVDEFYEKVHKAQDKARNG